MDVRQLSIFLAVVDEGGFTRAADALGLSQPAVSQAVSDLEGDLDVALFARVGRGAQLTSAGEALVLPARQVQRDLEHGRARVREVADLEAGRLDLACLPTLAAAPGAALVSAFRAAHPRVTVALADPEDTAELFEFVRSGRCELGIVEDVVALGLTRIVLGAQAFDVVLPPGSKAVTPFPLRRLATEPIVAAPKGSSTRRLLDDALARYGVEANVVVETAQREALLPLIAAGAGAGLLPHPLGVLAAALGCVVVDPTPRVEREVALVFRDGPLTSAGSAFVELARGTVGALSN